MKKKEWKGTDIDLSCAVQVVNYLEEVVGCDNKRSLRSVYAAVTELLSNISHHAYPNKASGSLEGLWKVTASIQSNYSISIVVEDYGITIPVSIIRKINLKSDENNQYIDCDLIEEAVYQRIASSTEGRGQGLQSIVRNVDQGNIEHLGIRSRNGYFKYKTPPAGATLKDVSKLVGTSVEIVIPGVQK